MQKEAEKNSIKKSTKMMLKKAEEEDPTLFQYDELYDEMEQKKSEVKAAQKEKKEVRKYRKICCDIYFLEKTL